MTPVLVSVDQAGDLKLGRKKCRLHKKAEVVKVAKKYGMVQAEKLTMKELCDGIKMRAKNSPFARDLLHHAAKRGVRIDNLHLYTNNKNNVPLAKKRAAAKKRAEKKALDRKITTNFMRNMTRPLKNGPSNPAVAPRPVSRAMREAEAVAATELRFMEQYDYYRLAINKYVNSLTNIERNVLKKKICQP